MSDPHQSASKQWLGTVRRGIIVVLALSGLKYSQGSHSVCLIIGSKLPQNNSYPPFHTTLHIARFTGLSDNIVTASAHLWPHKPGTDIPFPPFLMVWLEEVKRVLLGIKRPQSAGSLGNNTLKIKGGPMNGQL